MQMPCHVMSCHVSVCFPCWRWYAFTCCWRFTQWARLHDTVGKCTAYENLLCNQSNVYTLARAIQITVWLLFLSLSRFVGTSYPQRWCCFCFFYFGEWMRRILHVFFIHSPSVVHFWKWCTQHSRRFSLFFELLLLLLILMFVLITHSIGKYRKMENLLKENGYADFFCFVLQNGIEGSKNQQSGCFL